MHYVYALYNKEADMLYIGQTVDVERRVKEHNVKQRNHSRFTARFHGAWHLIYSETMPGRIEALTRERALKTSAGRRFLRTLIKTIPE